MKRYFKVESNEDEKIKKELISFIKGMLTCHDKPNAKRDEKYESWIAWLEKQGEQKPTDKVEPKFKVGDWIINSEGMLRHILAVDKTGYQTDYGWLTHDIYDNTYHLWTIQDARKGDILQANKCTLIFDSLTKDIDGNIVISSWYYCDTKTFYGMGISQSDLWIIEGVVPATKEQRDLLFSKMKEAGYEWDCEKKELKMIKQNPVDLNSVSIRKLVDTYRNTDEYDEDGNHKGKPVNCMIRAYEQGIRDILKTIKQKNVNHVWSEENENGFSDGLYAIQQALINCLKLLTQE